MNIHNYIWISRVRHKIPYLRKSIILHFCFVFLHQIACGETYRHDISTTGTECSFYIRHVRFSNFSKAPERLLWKSIGTKGFSVFRSNFQNCGNLEVESSRN